MICHRCETKPSSCAACQRTQAERAPDLNRRCAFTPRPHSCCFHTTALRTYPTLLLVLLSALDKAAAKLGLRRVPEQTLCGLAVASGTAGALTGALALVLLQHKTRKQSFQLKYLIATGLALAIDNLL